MRRDDKKGSVEPLPKNESPLVPPIPKSKPNPPEPEKRRPNPRPLAPPLPHNPDLPKGDNSQGSDDVFPLPLNPHAQPIPDKSKILFKRSTGANFLVKALHTRDIKERERLLAISESQLRSVLKFDPPDPIVRYLLAIIMHLQGSDDEATKFVQDGVLLDSNVSSSSYFMALSRIQFEPRQWLEQERVRIKKGMSRPH